jgi:hypothetical protein
MQNSNTTGSIFLNGSTINIDYTVNFTVSSSNDNTISDLPSVTLTDSNCLLGLNNHNGCEILIQANNAPVGDYSVATTLSSANGVSNDVFNRFTVTVTAKDNITPPIIQKGDLSVVLDGTTITSPSSLTGNIVLSNSSGVESFTANIAIEDTSLARVTESCVLSSVHNSCPIVITPILGMSGSTSVIVSATNYAPQRSSIFTISTSQVPGTLVLNSVPSQILVGGFSSINLTLNNSRGIQNLQVNLTSLNSKVNISPSTCTLSSGTANSTCRITIEGIEVGSDTIIASAEDYTQATAGITVIRTFWTRLTGNSNQATSANFVYPLSTPTSIVMDQLVSGNTINIWTYDQGIWTNLNDSSLSGPLLSNDYKEFGEITPSSIFVSDITDQLWIYNGTSWQQKTNSGSNVPNNVENVYGIKSPDEFILKDKTNNLWTLEGSVWTKQTDSLDHPTNVFEVYGIATPTSIVMSDRATNLWTLESGTWTRQNDNTDTSKPDDVASVYGLVTPTAIVMSGTDNSLWTFESGTWTKQNDNIDTSKPDNVASVYGLATPTAIVMSSTDNSLWTLESDVWTKQTDSLDHPTNVLEVYGIPTPTAIVMSSTDNSLWTFESGVWTKQNDDTDTSKPDNVASVYGLATPTAIVMKDTANNLWTFESGVWIKQNDNTDVNKPSDVSEVHGLATPTAIVMSSTDNSLWTFDGNNWIKKTGSLGQPNSVSQIYGLTTPKSIILITAGELWALDEQ